MTNLGPSLELKSVQNDMCGLVALHTLCGVVEKLIQGSALALFDGVLVEQFVRRD